MQERYWTGIPPTACQLCSRPLTHLFYDARLPSGSWSIIDHDCYKQAGGQLGTGLAQRYERTPSGWIKTGG